MRVYVPQTLSANTPLLLTGGPAKHIQVLRKQAGDPLVLFNGHGGEYHAHITSMGRDSVQIFIGAHADTEREWPIPVHLHVACPANERMDWLVEKATELGVASITPIQSSRSVLRLEGERAEKRRQHWQAIACAACTQSGRNRIPTLHPIRTIAQALTSLSTPAGGAWLLTLAAEAPLLSTRLQAANAEQKTHWRTQGLAFFSGPEGGLDEKEEALLLSQGLQAANLGSAVLRAETAPLLALAYTHTITTS